MRYIHVSVKHRKVWDCESFGALTRDRIAAMLLTDYACRIEIADGLDVWVSSEEKSKTFRFFSDGPEYGGDGIIAGRAATDDIKGLPAVFNIDMVTGWIEFPRTAVAWRRPIERRPLDLRMPVMAPPIISPVPYLMQMYG